jgi:hypothetical protein
MMPLVVSLSNSRTMNGLTFTPFDKLMTGFDKLRANGIFITRITGLPIFVGLAIANLQRMHN